MQQQKMVRDSPYCLFYPTQQFAVKLGDFYWISAEIASKSA